MLTVPDRLGNGEISSEEDTRRKTLLTRWCGQYLNGQTQFRCVREKYNNPQAGFTHHYHVGITWPKPTKWAKLWAAKNSHDDYRGIDFRAAMVKKGTSADQIFDQYFANPSKYKAIDEHGALVYEQPDYGKRPSTTYCHGHWLDQATRERICDRLVKYYDRPCPVPTKRVRITTPAFQSY